MAEDEGGTLDSITSRVLPATERSATDPTGASTVPVVDGGGSVDDLVGQVVERVDSVNDEGPPLPSGLTGANLCTRCGWRWDTRPGSPDPPISCSRCRSTGWNRPPIRTYANSPDDVRWSTRNNRSAPHTGKRRARRIHRLREHILELIQLVGPDPAIFDFIRPTLRDLLAAERIAAGVADGLSAGAVAATDAGRTVQSRGISPPSYVVPPPPGFTEEP